MSSEITNSWTVDEFKVNNNIESLKVINGPKGRFMSDGVKSLGAVAKEIDFSDELQIIELTDTENGSVSNVLCNKSRYKEELSL